MLEGKIGDRSLADYLTVSRSGKVVGVFSSAVYFMLGEKMLLLHDPDYGVLPFGIAVAGISGRAKLLGLDTGMDLKLDRGVLKSNKNALEIKLSFRHEDENPADISVLPHFAEKAEAALLADGRSGLSIYSVYSFTQADKERSEDVFAATAFSGLCMLRSAMECCDKVEMEEALLKLIGLGRGLTPSLDDFVTGAMFLLNYVERVWSVPVPCMGVMCKALEKIVPERTNIYSAAYILSATKGEDFSIMRSCLENAGNSGFEDSVNRLLSVGGSSGADMLSGMCFAANYILKQRQFTL